MEPPDRARIAFRKPLAYLLTAFPGAGSLDAAGLDKVRSAIVEFIELVPDEVFLKAQQAMAAKGVRQRFEQYVELTNQLLAETPPLIPPGPFAERYEVMLALVDHVEQLWLDSVEAFKRESYATAVFLSVTCLEEVGKVRAAHGQLFVSDAQLEGQREKLSPVQRNNNPFFSHRDKLVLAAGAGALVNSRLDGVLGMERVVEFLDDVDAGNLRHIREGALYIAPGDEHPVIPARQFDRDTATFYVVLAGECMAEALGLEPTEWERLLGLVKSFEESVGIDPE